MGWTSAVRENGRLDKPGDGGKHEGAKGNAGKGVKGEIRESGYPKKSDQINSSPANGEGAVEGDGEREWRT